MTKNNEKGTPLPPLKKKWFLHLISIISSSQLPLPLRWTPSWDLQYNQNHQKKSQFPKYICQAGSHLEVQICSKLFFLQLKKVQAWFPSLKGSIWKYWLSAQVLLYCPSFLLSSLHLLQPSWVPIAWAPHFIFSCSRYHIYNQFS